MDLFVTPRYLEPSSAEDVAALEALVGQLPEGYPTFVAGYGGAVVDGEVRVYSPKRIVEELAAFRQRWVEYWFWASDDSSAPARTTASDLVIVADTFNGDEIVYLRGSPARLWLLPRDADVVEPIGSTFDQAVESVCNWILSVPRPDAPYSISALDEPRVMFSGTFPSGGDAFAELVRTAASMAFSSSVDEGDGPLETIGLADHSGLVRAFRSDGSQDELPEHWASISGAYEQPGTDAARVVERLRATELTEQTSA